MVRAPIKISQRRPYFAEVPYFLWGQVNYDSEGNCQRPTDRQWTELFLENRETNEKLSITGIGDVWSIEGDNTLVARAEAFLVERSGSTDVSRQSIANDANHRDALRRADAVVSEFSRKELQPFDTHLFWGSWKWIGWFATDFTATGRWIMHSVARKDPRAVFLCIDWLKQGTYSPEQSAVLRIALSQLTGITHQTDRAWVKWYEGGLFSKGHKVQFPQPEMESWLSEMKSETAIMLGETAS
jgi:hypothetical protein